MVSDVRLLGRGCGREILIIVYFGCRIGLRTTRDRPAGDPRKIHGKVREGEILIIVLFWVGIGECVERE